MKTLAQIELTQVGRNHYGAIWDVLTTTRGGRTTSRDCMVRDDAVLLAVKDARDRGITLTRITVDGVTLTRAEVERRVRAEHGTSKGRWPSLNKLVLDLMTAVAVEGEYEQAS